MDSRTVKAGLEPSWYPFQSFPESFLGPSSGSTPSVPSYFGNVCLRFLPVLDIVVHRYSTAIEQCSLSLHHGQSLFRFLELPPVTKSLETLIDHLGPLYKFHMKPITYLYNTLHYYELLLRNRSSLRKKLIYSIAGEILEKDKTKPAIIFSFQDR